MMREEEGRIIHSQPRMSCDINGPQLTLQYFTIDRIKRGRGKGALL
jgi:hypothetical protein